MCLANAGVGSPSINPTKQFVDVHKRLGKPRIVPIPREILQSLSIYHNRGYRRFQSLFGHVPGPIPSLPQTRGLMVGTSCRKTNVVVFAALVVLHHHQTQKGQCLSLFDGTRSPPRGCGVRTPKPRYHYTISYRHVPCHVCLGCLDGRYRSPKGSPDPTKLSKTESQPKIHRCRCEAYASRMSWNPRRRFGCYSCVVVVHPKQSHERWRWRWR